MWRSALALCVMAAGCDRVFGVFRLDPIPDAAPDAPGMPTDVVQIVAGGAATCALLRRGEVWCWGDHNTNLTGSDSAVPVAVIQSDARAIAVGDAGACALTSTRGALCWGGSDVGQLAGGVVGPHAPMPMRDAPNVEARDIEQIAVGNRTACVIRSNGTVACAGAGGLVGDGGVVDRAFLGDVPGVTEAVAITVGDAHACAVSANGTLKCWGDGTEGQLGPAPVSGMPVVVPGDYISVSAGDAHTCARSAAAASCWGSNSAGQLGDGGLVSRPQPAPVIAVGETITIEAGAATTYAILADRTVSAWGANDHLQLGDGTTTAAREIPGRVAGIADVVELSSRTSVHACARTRDGKVWCWGYNVAGQLGNGGFIDEATPREVVGLPTN